MPATLEQLITIRSQRTAELLAYLDTAVADANKVPPYYPKDARLERVRVRVAVSTELRKFDPADATEKERARRGGLATDEELVQAYAHRYSREGTEERELEEREVIKILDWDHDVRGKVQRGVIVGDAGGQLHCLRADNAELLYQARTEGRIYAAPLPNGDDLFVASLDGSLYRLDIANGSILWSVELGGELRASPALANGIVVAVSTVGKIFGVDAVRGTVRWKSDIAPESVGSPAIDKGRVYVGDSVGTVHCLDLRNGKPIWQRPTGTIIETGPTIRNNGLFIVNLDGEVLRLDQGNGGVVWRVKVGAEDALEPVATQTQLLVAVPNGIRVVLQSNGQPDARFVCDKEKGLLSVKPPGAQGGYTIVGFCIYKGAIYLTEYPQKGGPIYLNKYSWAQRNITLGVASPVPPPEKKGGKK